MKLVVQPMSDEQSDVGDRAEDERVGPTPEEAPNERNAEAADDLGARDDRGRESGDRVRAAIAVQLEEVRLERVERVEADAARERGGEHQPADRRVAPAGVEGTARDGLHLVDRVRPAPGLEPDVVHEPERDDERDPEHRRPQDVRHAEVGQLGDDPTEHRAREHRDPADGLRPPEDRLEVLREPGRGQRVDQPRLGRPGEEREPESEHDRRDRPAQERGLDLPHDEVQQGRREQRHGAEHEREPATSRVGHDARGNLEQDLADREERVRRERLGVVQPGVEQEQGVDAPDERRGERRQQGQDEVGALDRARRVGHRILGMSGRGGDGIVPPPLRERRTWPAGIDRSARSALDDHGAVAAIERDGADRRSARRQPHVEPPASIVE